MSSSVANSLAILQFPLMQVPLKNLIEWRNEDPNISRRFIITPIACTGIAATTGITSIAKFILGIPIALIPSCGTIGLSITASSVLFDGQVLASSIKTAITSLFYEKVDEFEFELM